MKALAAGVCLGLIAATASGQQTDSGAKCIQLAQLALPHTTVVSAQLTEAGKLAPPKAQPDDPANAPADPIFATLPAICHVVALSRPTADSNIPIEVWLPIQGWNGRFLGVGNGGFAGSIDYHRLAVNVRRGYATAATDTGHTGSGIDASWALGHPEKIADFGWRAVHEMSTTAEAVVQAFYGRAADHRYFNSCSDGGREALMEAERFPADYDGIVAGAPAYHWSHLLTQALFGIQTLEGKPESYIPATKLPAISRAVMAQCGDKQDGFVEDPSQCHFDPSVLLCKSRDRVSCLTAPQTAALKAIYAGPHARDGRAINPGLMPGAELGTGGWEPWITGSSKGAAAMTGFGTGYFRDMVYDDAGLDLQKLDRDAAFDLAVKKTAGDLDAANPDLSVFAGRGGKLILYHGWNDPAIPAPGTIDFYRRVTETLGQEKTESFTRLFMVPGMQHCSGGPGFTSFGQGGPSLDASSDNAEANIYRALESWVESGKAPEQVIASKTIESKRTVKTTLTRPICAYPKIATYMGTGNRRSAASWACSAAK